MKIMVSACLMGDNCKYDGGNNKNEKLIKLFEGCEIIKICPETMGMLPVPRKPVEISKDASIKSEDGISFDFQFRLGARKALELAIKEQPKLIVLQSRSPSCGVNQIYDGTFSGNRLPGRGIFAQMAADAGFRVVDIEDI